MSGTEPDSTAGRLLAVLSAAENTERVTDTYTGRGMYGLDCVAATTRNATALAVEVGQLWRRMFPQHDVRPVMRTRTDALGKWTILYWPGVSTDEGNGVAS